MQKRAAPQVGLLLFFFNNLYHNISTKGLFFSHNSILLAKSRNLIQPIYPSHIIRDPISKHPEK